MGNTLFDGARTGGDKRIRASCFKYEWLNSLVQTSSDCSGREALHSSGYRDTQLSNQ